VIDQAIVELTPLVGVRGGLTYADTRLSWPPGPIAATPNT